MDRLLAVINVVGVLDRLPEFVALLCYEADLPSCPPYESLNVRSGRSHDDLLPEAMQQMVRDSLAPVDESVYRRVATEFDARVTGLARKPRFLQHTSCRSAGGMRRPRGRGGAARR